MMIDGDALPVELRAWMRAPSTGSAVDRDGDPVIASETTVTPGQRPPKGGYPPRKPHGDDLGVVTVPPAHGHDPSDDEIEGGVTDDNDDDVKPVDNGFAALMLTILSSALVLAAIRR